MSQFRGLDMYISLSDLALLDSKLKYFGGGSDDDIDVSKRYEKC